MQYCVYHLFVSCVHVCVMYACAHEHADVPVQCTESNLTTPGTDASVRGRPITLFRLNTSFTQERIMTSYTGVILIFGACLFVQVSCWSYLYMGCYLDYDENLLTKVTGTMLKSQGISSDGKRLKWSLGECVKLCKKYNYPMAGIRDGFQCQCGREFDTDAETSLDRCNIECEKDDEQVFKCGGKNTISVYRFISLTPEVKPITLKMNQKSHRDRMK